MSNWKIAIDTGGTFTDCIAINPKGEHKRVKVLSTGRMRGTITGSDENGSVQVRQNWNLKRDLLNGYYFGIWQLKENRFKVLSFDPHNSILKISGELPESAIGKDFEVFSNEEAPILAARLVTETTLKDPLPAMDMRLGSTRGTNALLERKGTKSLLIVTQGFADLPRIGTQQRQHLFSLNIQKPNPLYEKVIEVKERIDSKGKILEPLSESEINHVLRKVYQSDCQVVVIALLNSYKNPLHEKTLLHLLRTKGYKYICASHELGQVISYLPRLQTSLVNGYLMPVIADYLSNIKSKLDKYSTLKIMTSSGGLIDSNLFHPKDSLFSGPAGGVIGAASFAERSGINKLLAFDMGGTSTDVSRYSGMYDYVYQTKVGDQAINSPALYIETVAAGGGSVCSFDGFKFSVGPESAGASPGPACYGAGGAFTVTDVNLLLGRIFPEKFGIPVNIEHARKRLAELRSDYSILNNLSENEILQGFFDIANEKMAKAIEKISVAKGYEPAEYSLLAFGGAGGIHACKIAEMLGIERIFIPYDAGILSAAGIAYARIERIIHRQILSSYESVKEDLHKLFDEMKRTADNQLLQDGLKQEDISSQQIFLYLRFEGQNDTIEIPFQKESDIFQDFEKKYNRLFGHYIENRQIELESVKMIVSGGIPELEDNYIPRRIYSPRSLVIHKSFDRGNWFSTPVYDIDELNEGASFDGPAVIINSTSTAFIDRGWNGVVNNHRDLIILRNNKIAGPKKKLDKRPEQVQLELFTNRFRSIAEEMGALLQRTAFSVNIKERLDFSCALLDKWGQLVVNAPHIPVHLGALGICVRKIKKLLELYEGDIVITNHPAYGGSHLPDVTLIAPVYSRDMLIGYVANRAHHGEIGGISPGSMPADAVYLEEEGVCIPPTYIARRGNVDFTSIEKLLSQSKYPTRALIENLADLQASVASIRKGVELMAQLCTDFGADKVSYYMQALHRYANDCVQKILGEVLCADAEATERLDDGSLLKVNISKQENKYVIDFSGTSPQHPTNMNATPAIVNSVVLYVLRLLIDDNIPLNEGILENIVFRLPNCLLNPLFDDDPAKCPAVVGGNVEVSQRLVDTLLKAFNQVACSQGTMNNLLFGNDNFGFYETICGGVGAGKGYAGASAVHQHMTNTKITDPEVMEFRYPVRVERFAIRKESGGKGQWNGGDGAERQIRFLEPVKLTILSQHRNEGPYGIQGGEPGMTGEQWLIRKDGEKELLPGIITINIEANESVLIKTPGGGAFGGKLIRQ